MTHLRFWSLFAGSLLGIGCSAENGQFGGGAGDTGVGGAPTAGASGTTSVSGSGGQIAMPAGAGGTIGAAGAGSAGKSNAGAGGSGGATNAGAGAGGKGGAGSGGNAGSTCNLATWPAAAGSQSVSDTIDVGSMYDGGMKRFTGSGALGSSGQAEDQPPMFELANGATLKNVIIGSPAADGIHCRGSCTLQNVWWEDVGEDAATLDGTSSSQVMTIDCGGSRAATDKVFQHNGPGTMIIRNFTADTFSKLYRSCGNCSDQYERHVQLVNVTARNGDSLVGLNENYGDTATFSNVTIRGSITICERYRGNDTGAEPVRTGEGADAEHCRYQSSDIIRQ